MPLHLLGKKSWNVYNPANIERVKHDEAEAQARVEADEKRQQDLEAERRLAILRGEVPPALPHPASPPSTVPSRETGAGRKHDRDDGLVTSFRGDRGERKKRKRFGEDDTDFEMRVARERTNATNTSTTTARSHASTNSKDAPLFDSRGHISLFPEDEKRKDAPENQKNEEAERETATKRRELEDQYTMRFANAAGKEGVGVSGPSPWYASKNKDQSQDQADAQAQSPGKDAFGHEDPNRRARDAARVAANDPLAMIKRGAAKVRDIERERRALNEERANEMKQLRREEKRREKKRRHHSDVDQLEGFSLDAQPADAESRKRGRSRREHRSRSRDRDGRDKHRHRRGSGQDESRETRHRHHSDRRHESRSYRTHSRGDREDRERQPSGRSRQELAR